MCKILIKGGADVNHQANTHFFSFQITVPYASIHAAATCGLSLPPSKPHACCRCQASTSASRFSARFVSEQTHSRRIQRVKRDACSDFTAANRRNIVTVLHRTTTVKLHKTRRRCQQTDIRPNAGDYECVICHELTHIDSHDSRMTFHVGVRVFLQHFCRNSLLIIITSSSHVLLIIPAIHY